MDGHRFDELAKTLARGASRRSLLKMLGGGIAGGVLAMAGRRESDAFICRDGGILCAEDAQCCSGSCVNDHCACEVGQVACGPRCCAAGQVCTDVADGACCTPTTTCPTGQCGTFANGCGGTLDCGCAAGQTCVGGQCLTTTTTTSTTTAQPATTTTTSTTTTTTTEACLPDSFGCVPGESQCCNECCCGFDFCVCCTLGTTPPPCVPQNLLCEPNVTQCCSGLACKCGFDFCACVSQ